MVVGGLLHIAGGALVFYLSRRDMARRGLLTEGMLVVAAGALVGGLLGALLLNFPAWAALHWRQWLDESFAVRLLMLVGTGRTWIGALIGGYLVVELTKRALGIRRSTGDSFALALPLGEALGRLGCFASGCCYGTPAHLPWAVYQQGAWRHPAQLYAAAAALLLWLALRPLRDRLPREGDLFKLYLAGYAATRFLLEFLRDHQGAPGLSAAQWTCLASLALLALLWLPRFLHDLSARRAMPHEPAGTEIELPITV
jgi:phosphatidylglycerol---prolipoprotein diacylglyceryl transferase